MNHSFVKRECAGGDKMCMERETARQKEKWEISFALKDLLVMRTHKTKYTRLRLLLIGLSGREQLLQHTYTKHRTYNW